MLQFTVITASILFTVYHLFVVVHCTLNRTKMCAKFTRHISKRRINSTQPIRRNPRRSVRKDVDLNSVQSNNVQRPNTNRNQTISMDFSDSDSNPGNIQRITALSRASRNLVNIVADEIEANDSSSDGGFGNSSSNANTFQQNAVSRASQNFVNIVADEISTSDSLKDDSIDGYDLEHQAENSVLERKSPVQR